jgi:hypothetical protein
MKFEIIVDRLYKVVQLDEDEALFDILQQLKLQISSRYHDYFLLIMS